MSDMSQAVQVETTIEIDWAELGRVLADERSDRQAEFLTGFYEAVADTQLAFIGAERVYGDEREDIARVLSDLAQHIAEGERS